MQIYRNGQWIDHGREEHWLQDGSRDESVNQYGELHGLRRVWYPSGQLNIEDNWLNGVAHGRARGWYENGQPQFDATYVNDKEVDGKGWDESGNPR